MGPSARQTRLLRSWVCSSSARDHLHVTQAASVHAVYMWGKPWLVSSPLTPPDFLPGFDNKDFIEYRKP